MLEGEVEHGDSLGNHGVLGAGSVQWMTAGSGILHQEMPRGNGAVQMHGFQLWANLPAALKMTRPRYQDIAGADIPVITDDDGTRIMIITGAFWGKPVPSTASPLIPFTWMSQCRPIFKNHFRWIPTPIRLPTFLPAVRHFGTRPVQ